MNLKAIASAPMVKECEESASRPAGPEAELRRRGHSLKKCSVGEAACHQEIEGSPGRLNLR